ncbi:MAG TPA: glycosyltransferase family 4 protein, partial [Bryobacteraceae bacterium]|nr:glycosyltransferase family 4 protein [Bryobacteraceae bacterium]
MAPHVGLDAKPQQPDLQASRGARAKPIRAALILYVDSAHVGGSLRVGEVLGRNLAGHSVEPHFIFAYGGPGPVSEGASANCHFLGARGARDFAAWRRARRLVRSLNPDVLHFVNPVFWMALALSGSKRPKVLHVHGPMQPRDAKLTDRFIWRAFRHLMNASICVSHDMETKLLAAGWGQPDRTWTIYNAVDCDRWAVRFDKAEARARLGLPEDARLLGMVCRLHATKGCDDGIRLLAHLPAKYHLAIAGEGPEKQNLAALAASLGVAGRLHLLGLLNDTRLAYSAMDYLLFLSRTEPFGLLLAEAMAAGVPIVGLSGDGGYREEPNPLVTPDTAALLERPQPFDWAAAAPAPLIEALAARVQQFEENPDFRAAFAKRGQERVRARFDAGKFAA